ncbi:MAG: hypothetical protein V3W44_10840 [Dehalococcoidales bacterium]
MPEDIGKRLDKLEALEWCVSSYTGCSELYLEIIAIARQLHAENQRLRERSALLGLDTLLSIER